jgi:hypothetical protein
MRQRGIKVNELLKAINSGRVIETYKDDRPFPSVLVSGCTDRGRQLHAVIAVNAESREIYIITCYQPDPQSWVENFTKRKQK